MTTDLYQFLEDKQIAYSKHDHPAVFTSAEAERLVPPLEAASTKNLFLRDRKGKRHFLLTYDHQKQVDLKRLQQELETSKLSLGSPRRLKEYLGIEPGAVSLLALFNDRQANNVEVLIDREVWEEAAVQCHPLVNTATLVISREDLARFITLTGHELRLIDVPAAS